MLTKDAIPHSRAGAEESPNSKALRLLCEILPHAAREEFLTYEAFHWPGKSGVYRIRKNGPTEIHTNGRLQAHACLQLCTPAPSYDRMIAEFLILKNDENLYLTKANIVAVKKRVGLATILLIVANVGLALSLIWSHWL